MKITHLAFCITLFTFSLRGQNSYTFDKLLLYKSHSLNDTLRSIQQIVLINSSDNSFFAHILEEDSITFKLYFRDNDKLNFFSKIKKNTFYKAESIRVDCDGVSLWTQNYLKKLTKKTLKKLKINQLQDTIIGAKRFKYFRVQDFVKRRSKLNSSSYRYYIIDEGLGSVQPVLTNPFDYLLWKNSEYVNVGVVEELGTYNSVKGLIYKQKLDTIIKIDKKVILPDNCSKLKDVVIMGKRF